MDHFSINALTVKFLKHYKVKSFSIALSRRIKMDFPDGMSCGFYGVGTRLPGGR